MNQALATFDSFNTQLAARSEEIQKILPPHIDRERFLQTALIAAKNDPGLLQADRRSFHQAITEAAEDGLHPDGREGTITIFNERQKDGTYAKKAQWNPMLFGIRKRAKELCDMVIDAQVVYANDHFIWHQGDDPRIEHTPAGLGKDRGEAVGVYAIFRVGSTVLHREVMDVNQINQVRAQARGADKSLMWTKFWTEAWRKTVIRRGIKTVPSIPSLENIIKRVDKDFDFGNGTKVVDAAPRAQKPSRMIDSNAVDIADIPSAPPPPVDGGELIADAPEPAAETPATRDPEPTSGGIMDKFRSALGAAETAGALNSVWGMFESKFNRAQRSEAEMYFEQRISQLGSAE